MFDYIKRLQGRSIEERKRAAKIMAGMMSALILLIWLSTLGLRKEEIVVKEDAIDLAPLQNIKEAVGDIYLNFKNISDNLRSVENMDYQNNEENAPEFLVDAATTTNINEVAASSTSEATSTP